MFEQVVIGRQMTFRLQPRTVHASCVLAPGHKRLHSTWLQLMFTYTPQLICIICTPQASAHHVLPRFVNALLLAQQVRRAEQWYVCTGVFALMCVQCFYAPCWALTRITSKSASIAVAKQHCLHVTSLAHRKAAALVLAGRHQQQGRHCTGQGECVPNSLARAILILIFEQPMGQAQTAAAEANDGAITHAIQLLNFNAALIHISLNEPARSCRHKQRQRNQAMLAMNAGELWPVPRGSGAATSHFSGASRQQSLGRAPSVPSSCAPAEMYVCVALC